MYETKGTRVNSWIKLKNVNLIGSGSNNNAEGAGVVRDTLDLIPIGGFYGKGARTGIFGSYLMAAYSVHLQRFYTVCKLGTGFSQEMLKELNDSNIRFDDSSDPAITLTHAK